MSRTAKWLLGLVALLLLGLGGVVLALHSWIGSADFRTRAAAQASQALGVPVALGGLTVDVWPLPAVAVDRVEIRSKPPLTLERIEARPTWTALLRGRLEISTLVVRNAVVPQQAVTALLAAFDKAHPKQKGESAPASAPVALPRHVVLDRIAWVGEKGAWHVIDAEARMDDDGLPRIVAVDVKEGQFRGAQVKIRRETDHWNLDAKIGGGAIGGRFQLKPGARGERLLEGQFDTSGVEVSALTAPSRTLTGKIDAKTQVRGDVRDLPDSLRTDTRFAIRNAVVHGIDLAQAVKTVGMNRSGETALDTLAGNVATRGRAVQLNNLVATSGALSANGAVAMTPAKALSGHVTVSLAAAAAGGTLGVPLVVGGTLDSPSVTLSRGALIGAALGTAVAPGLGTGAGAKLGDRLGEGLKGLFGK